MLKEDRSDKDAAVMLSTTLESFSLLASSGGLELLDTDMVFVRRRSDDDMGL